jgi:protoporphyrinogen oxidase
MRKIQTETLIIGAGPAGMACALELSKAKKDFIIIEKQSSVGGLSKTYAFNENGLIFKTDNGPHRFFSKNKYLYEFIEDLLHDEWILVERKTRQYIAGKFYDYPVNALQALLNVGFVKACRIVIDYFLSKIQYRIFKKNISNFEEYVLAHFGRTLGEFNMINYSEKIWGIPAREIHADWAGQRIKGLSLFSLLKDTFGRIFQIHFKDKPKSLIDTFYYPRYGTGQIYETIAQKLMSEGYSIMLNIKPTAIRHTKGFMTSVIAEAPEGQIEIEFKTLVESVPLTSFVKLLEPAPPPSIMSNALKLRHRSQVYLFITLNKESVTKDQWIYFPEKDIPMARISEMKNFSKDMSPEGKTSLFVEFFCFENDAVWNMPDAALFDMALRQFEKINFFTKNEVRKYYVIRQKDVYPIYDLFYKEHLSEIKNYLDTIKNLYYIGRPGRFRYNNQDHSLEMGMLAAQSIIDGVRYDIESIGEEKEYFEKGSIPGVKTSI